MNAETETVAVAVDERRAGLVIVTAGYRGVDRPVPGRVVVYAVEAAACDIVRIDDARSTASAEKVFVNLRRVEAAFIDAGVGEIDDEVWRRGDAFRGQPGEIAMRVQGVAVI